MVMISMSFTSRRSMNCGYAAPRFPSFYKAKIPSYHKRQQCDALVIPGGESTVMLNQARNSPGLMPALQAYLQDPSKPVYGSCAGMILMAREDGVGGGKRPQKGLGAFEGMNVWRNAYGGELRPVSPLGSRSSLTSASWHSPCSSKRKL